MSAILARRRLKNLLLFIPNMLLLCARLLKDPRVPGTEKALLAGAIVYAIIPFDLIPDMIPFVGQIDDAYLIALTLLRLMDRTDPKIVREHWAGGGDVVELVGAAAMIAAKFLPKPIRRVLTSRVEVAPDKAGKAGGISRPVLVARTEKESEAGARQ
jgi:uncharacterized membrane protein YkvA (DUF1232 family)